MSINTLHFTKKEFFNFFKRKDFFLKLLKKKNILVFKKVFVNDVNLILKRIKFLEKKKFRFKKPRIGCSDIIIFNRNNKKSKHSGFYKKFLLFPWNKENLDIFFRFKQLNDIRFFLINNKNLVNNKNYFYDSASAAIQVMLYPRLIGFLGKHTDTGYNDYLCKISLDNYKFDSEDSSNGLIVYDKKEKIYIDPIEEKGDVIFINANLFHEVTPSLKNNRLSAYFSHVNF